MKLSEKILKLLEMQSDLMTCKPESLDMISTTISSENVSASIPTMNAAELWGDTTKKFWTLEYFKIKVSPPYLFKVKINNQWYLINTEGYDYAKYWTKII